MPPADALPPSLVDLLKQQRHVLDDERWDDDVQSLSSSLTNRYGFRPVDQGMIYPMPEKVLEPLLSEEELFVQLQSLPGWEPVETFIPRDYPRSRHELRRGFRFKGFKDAIAFLQSLVAPLNKVKHHPRIENQWRTVFIHFTTWDVGNRITSLDVDAAHIVDLLYKDFCDSLVKKE